MTDEPIVCPKCNATMQKGFILEDREGPSGADQWIEGEPEHNLLGFLKTRNRKKYQVTTYRCAGCGYLESYALHSQE